MITDYVFCYIATIINYEIVNWSSVDIRKDSTE
jgi:hypothetical protein